MLYLGWIYCISACGFIQMCCEMVQVCS